MNKIISSINLLLFGGALLILSCTHNDATILSNSRKITSDQREEVYLQKGLYKSEMSNRHYFVADGRAKVVFNLPPYLNPEGSGIMPELIKTIDESTSSIRMSVFQFNHVDVFAALKKAVKRGVKVYISTDLCYSGKTGYKEYYDDLRLSLFEANQNPDLQIVDDKTPSCDTMFNHNKYMIIDYENTTKTKAWFGSFNPTNHGAVENVELAIIARDFKTATILKLDFDQQMNGKYKVNKNGVYSVFKDNKEEILALSDADVKAKIASGHIIDYPKVVIGEATFEFILSPKVKSLTKIIEEVYRAEREILFSSFAIADQMLISSLINKSNSTDTEENLFSVLLLPHPSDNEGITLVSSGDKNKQEVVFEKSNTAKKPDGKTLQKLAPIVQEIKETQTTPVNYLTPNNEIKSTFKYIYPKGKLGGKIRKVAVEGIFNSKVINEVNTYQRLVNFKIPVFKSTLTGELHNKLFLIDEKITIFGSHNFSQAAENGNDELTVVINSANLTKYLKDELYNKTKLFSAKKGGVESFTSKATLVISEIMSESKFKIVVNGAKVDAGDYVEIYNYGNKAINLLGFRLDDHFFPEENNVKLNYSTNPGFVGTLVRFTPNGKINSLGVLDFKQENNILPPKKVALIVGKYFNESYYKDSFFIKFKNKYQRDPRPEEYPILFSYGEYFSSTLGDRQTGITSKEKLTLFGIDGTTVVDRFQFPQILNRQNSSLERSFKDEALVNKMNNNDYRYIENKYYLKNGLELFDSTYRIQEDYSELSDWRESIENGSTPGIVNNQSRVVASTSNVLYTIDAEVADVESNEWKKMIVVIENGKFKDLLSKDNAKNYPAPIIKDVLLYPGLIDTHNHVKYNTMPIWKVRKVYDNRNQWPEDSIYKNGVKELYKKVYGQWPACDIVPSEQRDSCLAENRCKVIKYAELKALIGGTTSIQGSSSFDETSSDVTFKGLSSYTVGDIKKNLKSKARVLEDLLDNCSRNYARNIERELWNGFDEVRTTAQPITADAFAKKSIEDTKKYPQTLTGKLLNEFGNNITKTFFIHLGEGKDQSSKNEWSEISFLKLAVPQVTIIHGTAFSDSEFKSMGEQSMSLAWSPTSNLLLYSKTTDIPSALKNNVNVSIGSDWSLSGTKSLLYELKIADQVNKRSFNNYITKKDLLKMVTINAAKAAHLENKIGSVDKNKLADFFIVNSKEKEKTPFDTIIKLNEEQILGVFVGGLPVVGHFETLKSFNRDTGLDSNELTTIKDQSCYKTLTLVEDSRIHDTLINELSYKTNSGFTSLKLNVQIGLGNEFSKLDPLCSDGDSRMKLILNTLKY